MISIRNIVTCYRGVHLYSSTIKNHALSFLFMRIHRMACFSFHHKKLNYCTTFPLNTSRYFFKKIRLQKFFVLSTFRLSKCNYCKNFIKNSKDIDGYLAKAAEQFAGDQYKNEILGKIKIKLEQYKKTGSIWLGDPRSRIFISKAKEQKYRAVEKGLEVFFERHKEFRIVTFQ